MEGPLHAALTDKKVLARFMQDGNHFARFSMQRPMIGPLSGVAVRHI